MKKLIYFAIALMSLARYQMPATAAPTHKPMTKAEEAQRYTATISVTDDSATKEQVILTLAGHTGTYDDQKMRYLLGGHHADLAVANLKPGVYTATVTLLNAVGIANDPTMLTTITQKFNVYSRNGLIDIISVGKVSLPPHPRYVLMSSETADLFWEWGSDRRLETNQTKDWLAQHTINRIGDTCKIVFSVGSYNTAIHDREFQHSSSKKAGDCQLKKYISGANFIGKPIWADASFFPMLDAINRAAGDAGVKVSITASFRMTGQKLSGTVVTPAKESNHLVGHAIDMNVQYTDVNGITHLASGPKGGNNVLSQATLPPHVADFIQRVKAAKLRWGGDFKARDVVHFDDYYNRNMAQWKLKYSQIQKCAKMSGFVP